jgi:hypothetical protein
MAKRIWLAPTLQVSKPLCRPTCRRGGGENKFGSKVVMAKKYEYLRSTYRQEELLDNLREEGANGWELCSATARKQDKYVNAGTSNMQYVSVEMYVDCIFKREKEEVVEKEFVWDDYLVIELLSSYAPFADNIYTIPKHIENFKELKSNSIKSGKGTANDVLNTEEGNLKYVSKEYIDSIPPLNTEIKSGGHGGGSVYGTPLNTEETIDDFWKRHNIMGMPVTGGYYFIYNDVQCFGQVSTLPYTMRLKIRPCYAQDDIGSGAGQAVYKDFPRPTPSQPQNNKEKVGVYVGSYNHGPKYGHVGQYDFICDREIMDSEFRAIEAAISKILNHE